MGDYTLHVTGLRELNRAFASAGKDVRREVRDGLRKAAEPVRADATRLAVQEISHIGPRWSEMRVGVTSSFVYVAPKRRGTKNAARKRRNLAPLLMQRAMVPAAEKNAPRVRADLTRELYRQLIRHGFTVKGTGL